MSENSVKNTGRLPGVTMTPFQALKRFGQNAASAVYGGADKMMGGLLPGGPNQGGHKIPLKSYIDKRRIKGQVLNGLQAEVDMYIRNGLQPEHAVRFVLQNKRNQFRKMLNPRSEEYQILASGDMSSPKGQNVHNIANTYKYFETASPREMSEMFSKYNVTDAALVKDAFVLPDIANVGQNKPSLADLPSYAWQNPSLGNLPQMQTNKMGLMQNEAGEWVPSTRAGSLPRRGQ